MKTEEAIRHLCTYSTTNGSGQTTDKQHEESKHIAIKAIEALENIKKDIAIINTNTNYRRYDSNFWEGFYMVTDIINKYYPDEVET